MPITGRTIRYHYAMAKECSVETCSEPSDSKGMCPAHYARLKTHGDVMADVPIVKKRKRGTGGVCGLEDCDRPAPTHFLCGAHRYRERKFGDPYGGGPIREMIPLGTPCRKEGCDRPSKGRGLCGHHYRKWLLEELGTPEEQVERQVRERTYAQQYRDAAKDRVFEHYGESCGCCGESTRVFLAIDHIENNGAQHRREVNVSGDSVYRWLVRNDFPEGFQTLCHNCNWAKYALGSCPHQG